MTLLFQFTLNSAIRLLQNLTQLVSFYLLSALMYSYIYHLQFWLIYLTAAVQRKSPSL